MIRGSLLVVAACAVTGCASVEVKLPSFSKTDTAAPADADAQRQREDLADAIQSLEERPWGSETSREDTFMTLLFGGSPDSPRAQAEAYLAKIDGDVLDVVRRDLERSLAATWNVARVGRRTATAMEPVPADLQTIENAIVEARTCRLVYAEALRMLMKDEGDLDHADIRRVKEQFNQAILELGRTADVISVRLESEDPVSSYAEAASSL